MTEKLTTTNVNLVNMIKIFISTNRTGLSPKYNIVIFIIFSIFGHIHPYFGQDQRLTFLDEKFRSNLPVNVLCSEIFSVKF